MGLAGLVAVGVPAFLVLAVARKPLTAVLTDSDINSGDPDVLRNLIFVIPERYRIFELADGSYMMHPSLLLDPIIAAACLLGIPFVLWRLKSNPAAQLLLGMMYLTTVVVYVPAVATFLGNNVVLPGQIWRLAWPIPLAALLALGWLVWEAIGSLTSWLGGSGQAGLAARTLPLVVLILLALCAVPPTRHGIAAVLEYKEAARESGSYPVDPIYPWFQDEIDSPRVVLASDVLSARIPAYSAEANVVSRRGSLVLAVLPQLEQRVPGQIEVPQGARDVQRFFRGTDLATGIEILRRHRVDYVMVESGSGLDATLNRLSGFEPVREPSPRNDLYAVNLQTLAKTQTGANTPESPLR